MSIYNRPESVEVSPATYEAQFGSLDAAREQLFNVGAGQWAHPGWTNLDLPPQSEAYAKIQSPCIHHDLVAQKELPIASGTASAFYCSHVVEHLPQAIVENLMAETHRCLRPGGVFRIVTGPDADLDWSALLRGDRSWWFWMDQPDFARTIEGDPATMTNYDRWLHHLATPRSPFSRTPSDRKYGSWELEQLVDAHRADPGPLLEQLTGGIPFSYKSPGDHISWWNAEKLERCLRAAGFQTVVRSAFGQSTTVIMRDTQYFDRTYPQISVYVEGVK